MDSATTKKTAEQEKQAEIRRQIALLQAQLDPGSSSVQTPPSSPKRKRSNSHLLAPATPSPKKKKPADKAQHRQSNGRPVHRSATSASQSHSTRSIAGPSFPLKPNKPVPPPAPSAVIQKLAQAHKFKDKDPATDVVTRSTAFTAKAAPIAAPSEADVGESRARNEDLTLVEDLTLGPSDHKPPFDDPHFEKLEPNSGIRLSSRVISHEDFQNYLEGRYYISPSKLYSVVRLLPSKQGYDVPVSGDWLTIAVIAERGPMKYTQAPVGVTRDDKLLDDGEDQMDSLASLDDADNNKAGPSRPPPFRKKPKEEPPKPSGKKYVNLKLIDFGCRSHGPSADGGKAKIRGDAFLSLLLFESDRCDVVLKEGGKKEKIYRGGSRGAFERMSKLREGAVVAFLNPKILKPFQRSADRPHPTDNILALTPESDASIAVIGYAQDLGTCRATKRDGSRCTGWCDKRVSDVCDYHIQYAVERKRAARPEFSMGTGGMSTAPKKKPAYDPGRQWGLKPERESTGATYVVQGHVISGGADSRSLYVGETVGRDAQAKAARKLSAVDSEKALQRLLKRDREGAKALVSAREFSKRKAAEEEAKDGAAGKKLKTQKDKDKDKTGKQRGKAKESEDDDSASDEESRPRGHAYSASLIKQLGFDPTAKNGQKVKDDNVQNKLDALAAVHASRKIQLGPRPGKKNTSVRPPSPSRVSIPSTSASASASGASTPASHNDLEYADGPDSPLHIPDSDDDELEREEVAAFGRPVGLSTTSEKLIDLDDSD